MKILGQVVSIHPLAPIVSIPNQLLAHVPITKVLHNSANYLNRPIQKVALPTMTPMVTAMVYQIC